MGRNWLSVEEQATAHTPCCGPSGSREKTPIYLKMSSGGHHQNVGGNVSRESHGITGKQGTGKTIVATE